MAEVARHYLTFHILETMQDRAIVTVECL